MTNTFSISREQEAYIGDTMHKVSRSFALVVPYAEPPLNHYLAAAYLLCRVVDNVEDCLQPFDWKQVRFSEILHLLREPHAATEVLSYWRSENWPGLTVDEWQLMTSDDAQILWQVYASIPDESRESICRWISSMTIGLSQLDLPDSAPRFVCHGDTKLTATPADYDEYCYLVAGTVGHMSSELVIQHYQLSDGVANELLVTSEACGRALQKTNIVKDFTKDLFRNICYLPDSWLREASYRPLDLQGASTAWTHKVLLNVVQELEDATRYVLALPYSAAGYRMATLLCLLPAYQTILLAAERHRELFTADHQVKISRQTLAECIRDAQSMAADNNLVREYGRQMKRVIDAAFKSTTLDRQRALSVDVEILEASKEIPRNNR
jgi:farnesyl-diphosphate farnesyltransferase